MPDDIPLPPHLPEFPASHADARHGARRIASLEDVIRAWLRDEIRAAVADVLGTRTTPAKLVSIAEYAAARSISPSTVRAAIRDGRLPATRIGRAVRIATNDTIGAPVKAAPRRETATDIVARLVGGAR